ncbi:MAG: hypothetical protein KDC36_02235 [Thermoleophilia bacterium]|nr:hypothetical protein [Thermoleophilia bacterium]
MRAVLRRVLGRWGTAPAAALVLAVALAAVIRLWVLHSPVGRMESDEAVTGVMAQRILDGELFAFFAGQTYMGSLEQYAQAAVLAVTPDTPTTLRMVQLALSVATCLLVGVTARRLTNSPWFGVAAAALFAVGPWFNVEKGIRSHGAYDTAQLLSVLGLLLVVNLSPRTRLAPWRAAAVGFVAGLALWESTLAIIALLPVVWWAIGVARHRLPHLLPPALIGAVLGAAPFIVHRIIHGPFPPSGSGEPPATTFADRTDLMLSPVLGMFLGVRHIGDGRPVSQFLPPAIATMIALGALGAGVWSRRRGIRDLVLLRAPGVHGVDPILVVLSLMVIPYGLTGFTWFAGTPRYLFALYPFAILAVIVAASHLGPRARLAVPVVLILGTAVLSASAANRALDEGGRGGWVGSARVYTEDIPAFVHRLERDGITGVHADYWLAYPIQYASEGALAVEPYGNSRFPNLDARVESTTPGAVAYAIPVGPEEVAIRDRLRAAGATARVIRVGRLVAFTDVDPATAVAAITTP